MNKASLLPALCTVATLGLAASPALAQHATPDGGEAATATRTHPDQGKAPNANRFVVGTLVDTRAVRVSEGEGMHRLLKLEGRDGAQIIVDAGPSPSPSEMGFEHGDLIVAMGKSARINGHPVLYAYYLGELRDLTAPATLRDEQPR